MTGPEPAGGRFAGGGIGEPQTVVGLLAGAGVPCACASVGSAAAAARSATQVSARTICLRINRIPKHLSLLDLLGDSDDRPPLAAGFGGCTCAFTRGVGRR